MSYETYYGVFRRDERGSACGPYGMLPDLAEAERVAQNLYGEHGFAREANPDHMQGWGYGKGGDLGEDGKPRVVQDVRLGTMARGQTLQLVHGEHPHSRSDNNYYAISPGGRVEAFDGHRLLHEIEFEDCNYLKESGLSGDQIRRSGTCTIKINGQVCDVFSYRDIEWALLEARNRLSRIHEFGPCQLWDPEDRAKLVGRKVYWRNTPAVITSFIEDQACVLVKIDDGDNKRFPLSPYDQEDQRKGEYDPYDIMVDEEDDREYVKDSIWSATFWWYRD